MKRESSELDDQLRQLRTQEEEVRRYLKRKAEEQAVKNIATSSNSRLHQIGSAEELEELEAELQVSTAPSGSSLSETDTPKFALPASIRALDTDNKQLIAFSEPNWALITSQLDSQVPVKDVEKFVAAMPNLIRSRLVPELEKRVTASTQFLRDKYMEAWAERADPQAVERLFEASTQPTEFTFAHLAKAYFRTRDMRGVLQVLPRMDAAKLRPSLVVHTTVVQALVQNGRYDAAVDIFDNLKYLSTSTQPDVKLYNTMMLVAAKQHNTNKVLDLFNEMKSRPMNPVTPSAATYDILIFSCARDERTHLLAWDMFVESRELGHTPSQGTLRALLYLCGQSGEVLVARALIRQLFLISDDKNVIDSFVINSLMHAYCRFKPDAISKVLSRSIGQQVRNFIQSSISVSDMAPGQAPPLLPVVRLTPKLILAESQAMIDYIADQFPNALRVMNQASSSWTSLTGSPVLFSHLRIALEHSKDIAEFRRRYEQHTRFAGEPLGPSEMERTAPLYVLAMQACTKFHDLEWAREIWAERGRFRRESPSFCDLPKKRRVQLDVQFARELVKLLSVCGEVQDAIRVVSSTFGLKRWHYDDLKPLVMTLLQYEDYDNISRLEKLLNKPIPREWKA